MIQSNSSERPKGGTRKLVRQLIGRFGQFELSRGIALLVIGCSFYPIISAEPVPLSSQPFPDAAVYADSARQLVNGRGYVTMIDERQGRVLPALGNPPYPPRYPFGTSIALTPFVLLIDEFPRNVSVGAKAFSLGYLLAIAAVTWVMAGATAAAFASLIVGFSPFAPVMGTLVLSDALGAMLSVMTLLALLRGSRWWAAWGAISAGFLVDVRFFGVVVLMSLVLTIDRRRRIVVIACALPFLLALAYYQWWAFGSPVRTGYDFWLPRLRLFEISNLINPDIMGEGPFIVADRLGGAVFQGTCPCPVGGALKNLPNIVFYPALTAGLFWIFTPPLVSAVGLIQLWRRRSERPARFAMLVVALNLLILLFYFYQGARLFAPAAALLVIFAAEGLSDGLRQIVRFGARLPTRSTG